MHRHIVLIAAVLCASPVIAFEATTQAVIDATKIGKRLPIEAVGTLMLDAERWCYNQDGNLCAWSDIYLSVDEDTAIAEISHPWTETVNVSFVIESDLRDGFYVCERGFDWVPSLRAQNSVDGIPIGGRELETLRQEVRSFVDTASQSACYDYIYRGSDADAQTITLVQRDYAGAGGDALGEATVTLHFDKATAEDLGWYW